MAALFHHLQVNWSKTTRGQDFLSLMYFTVVDGSQPWSQMRFFLVFQPRKGKERTDVRMLESLWPYLGP